MKLLAGLGVLIFLVCFVQMGLAGEREDLSDEGKNGGIKRILKNAMKSLGTMLLSIFSARPKVQLFHKDYLTFLFGIVCVGSFGTFAICVANLFHPNANPIPLYQLFLSLMVFIFSCVFMALNRILIYEDGTAHPAWLISSVGTISLVLCCWLYYGPSLFKEKPNVSPTPTKVDVQAGTLSLAIPSPAPNMTSPPSKESFGIRSSSDTTPPFCWMGPAFVCLIIVAAG